MCWKMWASRLGGRTETTSGWHQVVAARRWQQGGEAGGSSRSVVAAEQQASKLAAVSSCGAGSWRWGFQKKSLEAP